MDDEWIEASTFISFIHSFIHSFIPFNGSCVSSLVVYHLHHKTVTFIHPHVRNSNDPTGIWHPNSITWLDSTKIHGGKSVEVKCEEAKQPNQDQTKSQYQWHWAQLLEEILWQGVKLLIIWHRSKMVQKQPRVAVWNHQPSIPARK